VSPFKRAWAIAAENARFIVATPTRVALIGAAFALGAVAAIPSADAGFNYTWKNAEFCDDCHIHDYANEAFFRSAHANVTTCHDCHRVPIMHYPWNMYVTITHGPLTPEEMHRPNVPTILCATCHTNEGVEEMTGPMTEALRQRIVKIDDSPLHLVHRLAESRVPSRAQAGPAEPPAADAHAEQPAPAAHGGHAESAITCMDCHGSENNRAHQFRPNRENCVACHTEADHAGGRLDQLQCQECHFDGFVGRPGVIGEGAPALAH
jgi:hypothetical protein